MSDAIKRATNTLFPSGGIGVANIKFFPGFERPTSAEGLAEALNRAEAELAAGILKPEREIEEDLTPRKVR